MLFLFGRAEDEKETWSFLKVLFEDDGTARTKLLNHLGFSVADQTQDSDTKLETELSQKLSLDEKSPFDLDSGESFFNNPSPQVDTFPVEAPAVPVTDPKPSNVEESSESVDSSFDDSIRHALIIGDYKKAVSQCVSANRMADALVIAQMGGPALWESTRDQFLKQSRVSYLKVSVLFFINL